MMKLSFHLLFISLLALYTNLISAEPTPKDLCMGLGNADEILIGIRLILSESGSEDADLYDQNKGRFYESISHLTNVTHINLESVTSIATNIQPIPEDPDAKEVFIFWEDFIISCHAAFEIIYYRADDFKDREHIKRAMVKATLQFKSTLKAVSLIMRKLLKSESEKVEGLTIYAEKEIDRLLTYLACRKGYICPHR